MKITITNTTYQREHGHAPKGLGLWAFEVRYMNGQKTLVWASGVMLLSQAKKEIAERLKDEPIAFVSVAS